MNSGKVRFEFQISGKTFSILSAFWVSELQDKGLWTYITKKKCGNKCSSNSYLQVVVLNMYAKQSFFSGDRINI